MISTRWSNMRAKPLPGITPSRGFLPLARMPSRLRPISANACRWWIPTTVNSLSAWAAPRKTCALPPTITAMRPRPQSARQARLLSTSTNSPARSWIRCSHRFRCGRPTVRVTTAAPFRRRCWTAYSPPHKATTPCVCASGTKTRRNSRNLRNWSWTATAPSWATKPSSASCSPGFASTRRTASAPWTA